MSDFVDDFSDPSVDVFNDPSLDFESDPSLFGTGDDTGGATDLSSTDTGTQVFGAPATFDIFQSDTTDTGAAPTDLAFNAYDYGNGANYDPNTGIYTDGLGTQYENVVASVDGSMLMFPDGSSMDMATGATFDDQGNPVDTSLGPDLGTVNNNSGAGTAAAGGKSSASGGGSPFGGGGGGGSKAAAPQQQQSSSLSSLEKAIASLGSGMTALLTGQKKATSTASARSIVPKTPAQTAGSGLWIALLGLAGAFLFFKGGK